MPTAAYYTLGCKVNQYETEKIRAEMEANGFETVKFSDRSDIYIVNTCTVTSIADGKSRHVIRQAVVRNPRALVIATGCYAELEPQAIGVIDGVDIVVPNNEKDEIARRVLARFPGMAPARHLVNKAAPRMRTRAVLKVQDGCDLFCAYCTVPFARSVKQSRSLKNIISETRELAAFGYKEIVLTGIRLGSYCGGNGKDIADIAQAVSCIDGIARVRLSSIEVWEITDKLISAMASNSKICPHLHVPLQSGDDKILGAMGRPYDTGTYSKIVDHARREIPGIAITTDILVGFPGETDDSFERGLAFVEDMGFSRLHVFRYSPRPMTKAAQLTDQIPNDVKELRSKKMIELGARMSQGFAARHVGHSISVLAENKTAEPGRLKGFTGSYVEVTFEAPRRYVGSIVDVDVVEAMDGKLIGKLGG
ncbi:MAG: tRNA (N(6)-L-threonylcarbamoyladenosine(37)-C(2))-methylthiotransferase MtaB [Armatimonadota bacterium]|nr:tRNA (N(6)-L-threonylcarbamoyladenosine(37)-C(2))-methylthiotransferase MtaB [Armatimonadota bacterium]